MADTRLPTRPVLARKARLHWDHRSGRFLLLYPERALALSRTAADIVRLCGGELTVDDIVERLSSTYAADPVTVAADVHRLLLLLKERSLVTEGRPNVVL